MTTPKTNKIPKSSRRTHRPRRHRFALEPRFLFDGAAAATVEQQEPTPAPEPHETQQADPNFSAGAQQIQPDGAEVSKSSLTDLLAPGSETQGQGRELVVVDSAVSSSPPQPARASAAAAAATDQPAGRETSARVTPVTLVNCGASSRSLRRAWPAGRPGGGGSGGSR